MIKKIRYILLLSFIILLGLCTKSQARITTSDPTVSSGGTATITINSQEEVAYGAIDVTSNGGLTFVSASGGQANGTLVAFAGTENKTKEIAIYKFKVPTVTETKTFKVVFQSQDMGNKDGEEVASSSATATVTVKPKTTSNGNDSSSGGSNSSGDSSSSSKDTETKPTFKSKNETVYSTDSGVRVRKSYSTSSSVLGSLSEGESLKRTGIATEKVNGILWSKVTYKGQTGYVSSSYLTTTKPVVKEEEEKPEEPEQKEEKDDKNETNSKDENQEKSNNTNLKTFEVTPTGLSPAFSNVTTEYTMTVDSEVDKIEIKAVAEDENAKVKISGNEDLEIGTNTINILVTAEDGTERTYVITVTKQRKEQLKLSELLVEGLPLEPEFDENVYEYTLELDKTDISELNITATPSKKSAEVEIVGNTELKSGENVITILVKSSDGEEITTYQITAKLPEAEKDIVTIEKNEDLYKYIGIGVAVFILLIIIIAVIKKSRNNDEDDEMDDYSELYNRRKKREEESENNNVTSVENKEEINLEELPELSDEDLPKFLRKDKEINEKESENKKEEFAEKENVENSKVNEEKMQEEQPERSKKVDELYAMSTDEKPRRKGKHF